MQVIEETQHWSRTMTIIEVMNNFTQNNLNGVKREKKTQRENGHVLPKVMRLDCFRLLLLLTKVITSLSLQLLNQGKYHQLVSDVASCITASGQQFSSGMTFYSNPKSQMGT